MGITRSKFHKKRSTGGRRKIWRKKRKYEMGRQPANTKLTPGNTDVRPLRVRGGNMKFRALRLDHGNFAWASEVVTRKTRIIDVVYNASNNELVRTKTLVKNAIVQVDATPFKQWYLQHYGAELGKKTAEQSEAEKKREQVSRHVANKLKARNLSHKVDKNVEDQFLQGRLYACIASRPGQAGRADGYILEGKELEFYVRRMQKKRGRGAA